MRGRKGACEVDDNGGSRLLQLIGIAKEKVAAGYGEKHVGKERKLFAIAAYVLLGMEGQVGK